MFDLFDCGKLLLKSRGDMMKGFILWIKQIFASPEGETSAKRVSAIALIASGIVGAFVGMAVDRVYALIGSGLALLGIAAFTKS
jgi:hypothetical protein